MSEEISTEQPSIAQQVSEILRDCLFNDDEVKDLPKGTAPENAVIVEGVMLKIGFHPERLEKHREEVKAILNKMPITFFPTSQGGGEGWSFLQLCMTRDDEQWGEHRSMDELLCLGIALKMAKILAPRDMWDIFPGGMPYLQINTVEGYSDKPTPDDARQGLLEDARHEYTRGCTSEEWLQSVLHDPVHGRFKGIITEEETREIARSVWGSSEA